MVTILLLRQETDEEEASNPSKPEKSGHTEIHFGISNSSKRPRAFVIRCENVEIYLRRSFFLELLLSLFLGAAASSPAHSYI
ncbi:hypothetical protein F2Q70_00014120 [Brassica cretica]|uniref:Uncharacterized protein n=1 Tax=Brassica cretica TaxID=69181 RepID=A0A8S9I2S4_BRACR|nr:hypothetical protein F2Q70_00014120 [Brassica cretica]KAF2596398.1 hypothetical protein F2Q68_00007161 [Brassica cretica]